MPLFDLKIDIIGRITPKGTGGHKYMLVIIGYFTKWVDAASSAKITSKHVAKLIISNIICRYGILHELISDQGSHFKKEVARLLENYKSSITNLLRTNQRQMEFSK